MSRCSGISGILLVLFAGCRGEQVVPRPEPEEVGKPTETELVGFYLLNEGNMGSNKSTLDFYDFASATYTRNIYGAANPDVPKELGDVGNDLKIDGDRLWAVINCSNKIEVMDRTTAKRIAKIDLPNCRSVAFSGGYAYVTSYAGPVEIRPDYSQLGFVAKIDVKTLEEVGRCVVGYQPDGIAVADGRIYVANSGGYRVPNYENTLSVIDETSFKVVDTVEIAVNLDNVVADRRGNIWVSSRGDYYGTESGLYCYSPKERKVIWSGKTIASALWLDGDTLYCLGAGWSYIKEDYQMDFVKIDTTTRTVLCECFITDGTQTDIRMPYGLAVNPDTKEIYIGDAGNYVNPGWLYCYSADGRKPWRVRTGDIPAHFAFLDKPKSN